MRRGLGFRIAGIPVHVDPTIVILAVLLGLGHRSGILLGAWVGIVLVSVLIHELGHAFAFRRFGQQPTIVLSGMGGATSGSGGRLPPARDLVVSVAGPLTPVAVLALPSLYLLRSGLDLSPTVEAVLEDLFAANVGWSVLNLLPVLPLDGGRVAASVFGLLGRGSGDRPAHVLSVVVGIAGAVVGLRAGYSFGAIFAGFLVAYNVGQLAAFRNEGLARDLLGGWRSLLAGDAAQAESAARAALAANPSRDTIAAAVELGSWAKLHSEGADAAAEALRRYPHGLAPNPILTGAIALTQGRQAGLAELVDGYLRRQHGAHSPVAAAYIARSGPLEPLVSALLGEAEAGLRRPAGPEGPATAPGAAPGAADRADAAADLAVHLHIASCFDEAARVGERALAARPTDPGRVAYNLACSQARAGNRTDALWWLERAADEGFTEVGLLDDDPDLGSVRSLDRFRAVRDRMGRR